ncbi:MAG: DUF1624 domain-containing protein [Bacteroidetes bacterium]|nr:DUF1624 domain-containing protein [Bacteroidota bacterium]
MKALRKNNSRKALPDFMKGLAVIFMVMVHVLELFTTTEFQGTTFGKVVFFLGGPPAAPVFMLIMGYFVALSGKSLSKHIFRGVSLIFLGLLLNTGLNFHLLIKVFLGQIQVNPLEYIFGADILFVAGLSIILLSLTKQIVGTRWVPFLILAFIIVFISPYLQDLSSGWKYLQAFLWGEYSWSYFPIFPWAGYAFAGYASAGFTRLSYFKTVKTKTSLLVFVVTTLGIILSLPYASRITANLPLFYHHSWTFFIWTLIFTGWWTVILQFIQIRLPDNPVVLFLQWTGRNVTAFYVFQWLIIGNIATALYQTQGFFGWLAGILVVLLCSTVLTKVYLGIKQNKNHRVNY